MFQMVLDLDKNFFSLFLGGDDAQHVVAHDRAVESRARDPIRSKVWVIPVSSEVLIINFVAFPTAVIQNPGDQEVL
jgi:hypothetical protein